MSDSNESEQLAEAKQQNVEDIVRLRIGEVVDENVWLRAQYDKLKDWALEAIRRERVKCIQDVGNFLADIGTNPAKTTELQVLEFIGANRGDPMLPEWAK